MCSCSDGEERAASGRRADERKRVYGGKRVYEESMRGDGDGEREGTREAENRGSGMGKDGQKGGNGEGCGTSTLKASGKMV